MKEKVYEFKFFNSIVVGTIYDRHLLNRDKGRESHEVCIEDPEGGRQWYPEAFLDSGRESW